MTEVELGGAMNVLVLVGGGGFFSYLLWKLFRH